MCWSWIEGWLSTIVPPHKQNRYSGKKGFGFVPSGRVRLSDEDGLNRNRIK